jgi:hypothetical protein
MRDAPLESSLPVLSGLNALRRTVAVLPAKVNTGRRECVIQFAVPGSHVVSMRLKDAETSRLPANDKPGPVP